jgi:hypothetical protein
MGQTRYFAWTAGVMILFQLGGCYRIRQWDVQEGREKVYSDDPSKMKSMQTARPVRGAIEIELVTTRHMACILTDTEVNDGATPPSQKVCHMEPIAGINTREEWMALYRTTRGNKSRSGYVAMNIGDALKKELEASLKQYYASVEVKQVDARPEQKDAALSHRMDFYVGQGDNEVASTEKDGPAKESGRIVEATESEQRGVVITYHVDDKPVLVWVPIAVEGEEISSRDVANAIRVSTSDLVRKIMAYDDEKPNSSKSKSESKAISIFF